jgi:hypothetical protein
MSATQTKSDLKSARRRADRIVEAREAAPLFVIGDGSDTAPVRSPARAIQGRLSRSLDNAVDERWSGRKTLLFIVLTCGGFWLALGAALASLRH